MDNTNNIETLESNSLPPVPTLPPTTSKKSLTESLAVSFFAIVLILGTIFSIGATGVAALVLLPLMAVCSLVYGGIMLKLFIKKSSPPSVIYTVAAVTFFVYMTIGFDFNPGHFSEFVGVSGASFEDLRKSLSGYNTVYFWTAIISIIVTVYKGKPFLKYAWGVLFLGVILFSAYMVPVLRAAPALREQSAARKVEYEKQKAERINSVYKLEPSVVFDTTIKDRIYSIFTPNEPYFGEEKIDCRYTLDLLTSLVNENSGYLYDHDCLSNDLGAFSPLPFHSTEPIRINLNGAIWKKGDVAVFVVELYPDSYVWVNAPGNNIKEGGGLKMAPFDYRGVESSTSTDSGTVYERSVVQIPVYDKPRKIMVLYPINIDIGKQNIELRLSLIEGAINPNVSLIEVARFTPPHFEPEWLTDWLKTPNPFLKNLVQ